MSDPSTIGFYDAAARSAGEISADGPPEPVLARFMAQLRPGADVLDLGCGHGIAAAKMVRAGFSVTGLDASAGLLEIARRIAPGARFVLAGFEQLDEAGAYDGVWANFALLHMPRERIPACLTAIATALRPGGLFHISLLAGQGELRDDHGRAYTFFAADEIAGLLRDAEFAVELTESGTTTGVDGAPAPSLTVLARKIS